ncbi:MAG: hypothetical protein ACI9YO_001239 [Gammaproteobacteria bacterium]|jgi:hypothetical protein
MFVDEGQKRKGTAQEVQRNVRRVALARIAAEQNHISHASIFLVVFQTIFGPNASWQHLLTL